MITCFQQSRQVQLFWCLQVQTAQLYQQQCSINRFKAQLKNKVLHFVKHKALLIYIEAVYGSIIIFMVTLPVSFHKRLLYQTEVAC